MFRIIIYFMFNTLILSDNYLFKKNNCNTCKTCMYHIPSILRKDFIHKTNKCSFFEEKNIITGEIKLNSVEKCRLDENMCGLEGRSWQNSNKIEGRIIYHKMQFYYICILIQIMEKMTEYIDANHPPMTEIEAKKYFILKKFIENFNKEKNDDNLL